MPRTNCDGVLLLNKQLFGHESSASDENMRSPPAATRAFGNSAENLALDGAHSSGAHVGPVTLDNNNNNKLASVFERWSANSVLSRRTTVYTFVPSDIRRGAPSRRVLPRMCFRDIEIRTFSSN